MSTSRGPRRPAQLHLAVACLLGALLSGCQDPQTGGGRAVPESDPGSPSASESPEVPPADGPVVENDHASYRVPRGFEVAGELAGTVPANATGSSRSAITLGEFPAFGTSDLATVARVVARNVAHGRPPRQLANATLDGEPAFHLEGQVQPGQQFAAYGAVRDDTVVYVRFDLDGSPAESAKVIASVLATWHWK